MGDDTDPEDEAWLGHRNSATMRAFARQLLAIVRTAQSGLGRNDHLLHHLVMRIRSGDHPFSDLERTIAIAEGREYTNDCLYSEDFYNRLAESLADPEVTSVAYCSDGDYRVLRMMATEQRRRASITGHSAGHALYLSALVDHTRSNEAWDSEIWFFGEGLAHGDLLIHDGSLGSTKLKALVEKSRRIPGRYILSKNYEGSIKGFDTEKGDGWVLYRKQSPDGRRVGLERIQTRRHSRLGPVLKFAGDGTSLFDYDKTVVVVGETVSIPARTALAVAMAEWQTHGGDPVFIVLGDIRPFESLGCRDLLQPALHPENGSSTPTSWLEAVLRQSRPWIDVIVALDAPGWATQALANCVRRQSDDPWTPWLVGSSRIGQLEVDHTLEGDLATVLGEAHRRAQMMRSRSIL